MNYLTAYECMPKDDKSLLTLKERARLFAQEIKANENELDSEMYIEFLLGKNERYGINYAHTKEVIDNINLTKIPGCPPLISGIINYRGTLIAVLNLKTYFQIRVNSDKQNPAVIIISIKDMTIGLLVDNIMGYQIYDSNKLDHPIPSEGIMKTEYVSGLHNGHTAILNIETILSDLSLQIHNGLNSPRSQI